MTENNKRNDNLGTVTKRDHIDDSNFDLAIHKLIHKHLLARKSPELTLGLLAHALGRIQASLIYGGASSETVSLVSAENMKLGFNDRAEEIRQAAETQAARTKNGETEH